MAFSREKINPLDLQPRKAIGVSLPFSGQAVFNSTFQTKDAIRNNIINFFLTGEGERYMNPRFGTILRKVLFDNIVENTIDRVKTTIRIGLNNYFPTVDISELEVITQPDNNTISIYLKYSIRETSILDEVLINFEQ